MKYATVALYLMIATSSFAGATLTDLWNGKAKWVADADNIGADFGLHYQSILHVDKELWAYYIRNYVASDGKIKMAIGRARSTDGINWTDDGMVLDVGTGDQGKAPAWDDRLASFPGVWKDGDTFYLVYEGASEDPKISRGDIGLATSNDGKTFVKDPKNPILRHEETGWERANIGTPSLFREKGKCYLFYHGFDFKVCQIGVASGKSLAELKKCAANPTLPVSNDTTAWDRGTSGRRSAIVKEGDYYYLAFEGSTLPPFEKSKWSSGFARTKDLAGVWEKFPGNPIIPQTPGGMGLDGPELVKIRETWYLYVRSARNGNASARFRLETQNAKTP